MNYYMKTLTLKLEDNIFQETEDVLSKVKKSRNRYIRKFCSSWVKNALNQKKIYL